MLRQLLFLILLIAPFIYADAGSRVLINEDFSRMPSGTPEVPWGLAIEPDADGYIPGHLTAIPGWRGVGVHQAGGSCALQGYSDAYGRTAWGYIFTPLKYMGGEISVSFRAKRLPGSRGSLWVTLYLDDGVNVVESIQLDLTTRWSTQKITFDAYMADVALMLQFSADGGGIVFDDLRVELERTDITAPAELKVINHSPVSFTACWADMNVDRYFVNLFTLTEPADYESGVISEGFDSPAPDGWVMENVDLDYETSNCGQSVPAVTFSNEAACLISPLLPQPLDRVEFRLVASSTREEEYGLTGLRVDVHRATSDTWDNIGFIANFDCSPQGDEVVFESDHIGCDVDRLRLRMTEHCEATMYVDDITLEYASEPVADYIVSDLELVDTHITFDELDPEGDYYWTVRAQDGEFESQLSSKVWFDGIEGLPVNGLRTSVEGPGEVTVNWNPMPRVDGYDVCVFTTLTAYESSLAGCTILEEDFTDGTDASLWQSTKPLHDSDGLGAAGCTVYGARGMIYSPRIDLSCNAGQGFNVSATLRTTIKDEEIRILVLSELDASMVLASASIECPRPGETSANVWVDTQGNDNLSDVIIAFISMKNADFYLDRVWVSQTVLPGETLFVPLGPVIRTEQPELTLSGLSNDVDHVIEVTASARRGNRVYTSLSSERVTARTNTSVSSAEVPPSEDKIVEYDLLGRPATPTTRLTLGRDGKKRVK